jgi:hypothetical protein
VGTSHSHKDKQTPSITVELTNKLLGQQKPRQSQSHVTTDSQSVCLSWCRGPSGTNDQIFTFILNESCSPVYMGRPLWREVGSVFCRLACNSFAFISEERTWTCSKHVTWSLSTVVTSSRTRKTQLTLLLRNLATDSVPRICLGGTCLPTRCLAVGGNVTVLKYLHITSALSLFYLISKMSFPLHGVFTIPCPV